jgi:predicted Zn-ribbon and HTH transcriptional regulator
MMTEPTGLDLNEEIDERLRIVSAMRNLVNNPRETVAAIFALIDYFGEQFISDEVEEISKLLEKRDGKLQLTGEPGGQLKELLELAKMLEK